MNDMTDRDNITLPREVVKLALEAFEAVMPFSTTQRELKIRAVEALRTHLAAPKQEHPGYVIGSHWLETAYSRICAGEAEADVLRDCGWERVDEALRRGNERYRWLRENARVWPSDKAVWADNQIGAAALWIKESVDWTDDASIDAAIDAAMGEKR